MQIEKFLAGQEGGEGGEEAEAEAEGEGEEEGATGKKRRRSSGAALGSRLSPELAAFLGMESCPRPQVQMRGGSEPWATRGCGPGVGRGRQ